MSPDPKSSVQSLAKGIRLLEAIAASPAEPTLSEAAAAAGLDPGTTHRMLTTLIGLGYLTRTADRRFALTLKVLDLGFHAIGRQDLRSIARPWLRRLVGEVSEAASLGVLSGTDVLYVERMRAGITRLGVDIRVGTTVPAAQTMIGWAILAALPMAECDALLATADPPADLPGCLAEVRAQGYALSHSRISSGLSLLAVAVRDPDGHPIAGLSVAAPAMRLSPEALSARALAPLQEAAHAIARALEAGGGAVSS